MVKITGSIPVGPTNHANLTNKYLMFKKLNLPPLDLTLADLDLLKGGVASSNFNEFYIKNKNFLDTKIAKVLSFNVPPDTVNITTITAPGTRAHKDQWPVALNFYLTAGDERTWIWRLKEDITEPMPTVSDYVTTFKFEELEKVDSYIAKQNEFYLLNTNSIHSVWKSKDSPPRHILRFAWQLATFEEVLDSIVPVSL